MRLNTAVTPRLRRARRMFASSRPVSLARRASVNPIIFSPRIPSAVSGNPSRRICALPAFWLGLAYDDDALGAARDIAKDWTAEQRQALRDAAPAQGLSAQIGGRSLREISADLLKIAESGLKARAEAYGFDRNESHFLNALRDIVSRGETPAEELLRKFKGEWGGDLNRVFAEYSF